jgi:hypothetical protein
MATFSVNLNGTAFSYTIADADWTRIMNAFTATGTTKNQKGESVVPTEAQVNASIANQMLSILTRMTQRHEAMTAAKSAQAAVAAIIATPVA